MTRKPVFVTQPSLPPLEEVLPYLNEIWQSRILTNGGPLHGSLEQLLCNYLDINQISLFNNGTIALLTAIQALDLSGEVITTPYSFVATSHSLLWNNLTPVFVDIDPWSLNIDPAKIEKAITPRTTGILAVHCYGNPCDVAGIQDIADAHGLKVLYDAAHAFGVKVGNTGILSYGDLSVLSLHATKVFNTFEGGAIICHSSEAKQRIDQLKNFGIVDEATVNAVGLNGKMSELNAAIGIAQLKYIDQNIEKRRAVDTRYREKLGRIRGIRLLDKPENTSSNHAYFPILITRDYALSRDGLYEKLIAQQIFPRRYFYPLISDFPVYRDLDSASPWNLPVASEAAAQVLCLPIYPDLEFDIVDEICRLMASD